MAIKAVLFDLDGTLLPMDYDVFAKRYFGLLAARMAAMEYPQENIIDNVLKGTQKMMLNDGSLTNEEVFWDSFAKAYGDRVWEDKKEFDAFYAGEFDKAKDSCGYTPKAKQAVETAKAGGRLVVLATNPLFPAIATRKRMNWAGLAPEDFYLYTTYEDYSYSKPNVEYYLDICHRINCKPEECLMVGNDVNEDMVAESIGMRVFLLTDCIINKHNKDISGYDKGSFDELIEYLSAL